MSFVLLALALLSAEPVDIRISLRQSAFWPGEPIRMDVRWEARRPTSVQLERGEFCSDDNIVRLVVTGPAGEHAYREVQRICDLPWAPWPMQAGDVVETRLIILNQGGYTKGELRSREFKRGPVFPKPGEYGLRLAHIAGESVILSNMLTVKVEMPPPEERPLLEQIRADPGVTWVAPGTLLRQYPSSRYLTRSRLADAGIRIGDAVQPGGRPDTGLRLAIAAEILSQEWGQFEEEALDLAYRAALPSGKDGLAAEIAAILLQKYPDSRTVWGLGLKKMEHGGNRFR